MFSYPFTTDCTHSRKKLLAVGTLAENYKRFNFSLAPVLKYIKGHIIRLIEHFFAFLDPSQHLNPKRTFRTPMGRVRPGNPQMARPKLIKFLNEVLRLFHLYIDMLKCHLCGKKINNLSKISEKIAKKAIKASVLPGIF